MPKRYISDNLTLSTTIDCLIPVEENFYCRLITTADDFGRFDARPPVMKARCFPLKTGVTVEDCERWAWNMALKRAIVIYEVEGRPFGYFPEWLTHQFQRAKTSRYPEPTKANTLISEHLLARVRTCLQMQADARSRSQTQADADTSKNEDKSQTEKGKVPNVRADASRRSHMQSNGTYTNTNTDTKTFTDYLTIISSAEKARSDFMFGPGLDLLMSQGVKEGSARKHLGRMISHYGTCTATCAVWQALEDGAGDARAYMIGVAKRIKAEGDQHGGFSERDYQRDATPEAEVGWVPNGKT